MYTSWLGSVYFFEDAHLSPFSSKKLIFIHSKYTSVILFGQLSAHSFYNPLSQTCFALVFWKQRHCQSSAALCSQFPFCIHVFTPSTSTVCWFIKGRCEQVLSSSLKTNFRLFLYKLDNLVEYYDHEKFLGLPKNTFFGNWKRFFPKNFYLYQCRSSYARALMTYSVY